MPLQAPIALPIADAMPFVVPLAVPPAMPLASLPAAPLAAAEPPAPTSPQPVQMEHFSGLQENVQLTPHGSRVHKLERVTPRCTRLDAEYSSPHGDRRAALQKLRLSERSMAAQARKRRKAGVPARDVGQQREDTLAATHRVPWGWHKHKGRWDTNFGDEELSAEELQELWVEGGGRGHYCSPTRCEPAELESPAVPTMECECGECAPCKDRYMYCQHRIQEALAENAKCECASRSGASLYRSSLEYLPGKCVRCKRRVMVAGGGGTSTSSGRNARMRWELQVSGHSRHWQGNDWCGMSIKGGADVLS